ncbi:MAG: amidase [Alphaproteobacteria bacterium]
MSEDIALLSAAEMVRRFRAGALAPTDVMEAVFRRIDALNPRLNAYVALDREPAMAASRAATAELTRGGSGRIGPLHGVPVSIKDVTPVAGLGWTFGSPLHAGQVATEDALIVQRLKAAGAIVVGKTNTPDFAFGGVTDNALFGPTRNPWDPRMTAGGSTGGGAAAVAAGMGPIAQGGDLGGSLRTPAAFCGIVGFRSSPGLVPIWPNLLPWDPNIVEGTMARTVEDIALSLAVIAGPDPRAPLSYRVDQARFTAAFAAPKVEGWRVAWTPDLGGILPVEPEVAEAVERAADAFREMGAVVERASPDFSGLMDTVLPTRGLIMAALHADKLATDRARLPPALVWNVELGLKLLPEAIAKGERVRGVLTERAATFFVRYDALLLPTEAVAPFEIGIDFPDSINGVLLDNPIHWFALAYAATAVGLPALSVPAGFTRAGLPIGMQIVVGHRREEAAIAAGAAFEAARPWAHRVPPCVTTLAT